MEFALTLPAVVVVLAVVLAGARHVADMTLATEAASTAARIAMVSGAAAGEEAGRSLANGRATVTVIPEGGWWVARATVEVPGPMPDVSAVARAHQP